MVRIQRPSKKKKQESLARRLFAAGAAGVTMLTGGILGLRSAGAVKPPVAQVRLRTDLAAGAGRAPGAAGITVAEEARIKAETERFLGELRRVAQGSEQRKSFLARLLNISPAQAEVEGTQLTETIQELYQTGGLEEAVREAIAGGGFTAEQAAEALLTAGISPEAVEQIAVNLGATPEQAAAYAQPSYVPSGEADAYIPPPAVLPAAPAAPIIPPPVVEPGPPVLPGAPSVPSIAGAFAPRFPGDTPPPLPDLIVPSGEERRVAIAGEEPTPTPERTVQTDGGTFIITPSGAVLDADRNPTPYTVDPSGQVFQEGSPTPIGQIAFQSPGIEEVPREVFVPTPPPAPAEPAPAPLPPPVTIIEYGGERYRVPLEGGAITTETGAPTPYRFEFEAGRLGMGRVRGPAGEEMGRITDGQFVPAGAPLVTAPTPGQPPAEGVAIGPPDWHVLSPGLPGLISVDRQGNFRLPDNPSFGEFAGATGHVDRDTLSYTVVSRTGEARSGNMRAEGWIIAAVAPIPPAQPAPQPAPVTIIEYGGERYRVPLDGSATITTETGAPTPYRFEFEPGRAGEGRVVGPAGEEIGRIQDGAFVPGLSPAPAERWPVTPAPVVPTPIPAPVAPVGTRVEYQGQVFIVPDGGGFALAPDGRPTQYYVGAELPGQASRVVRYGGPGGEPIGTVIGTTFLPRPEVATPPPTPVAPAISEIRASSPRSFINSGENVGITSVFRLERPVSSFEYRVDLPSGFTYVPGTAILRGVTVDVEPRIERRPDGGFTVNFILLGVPEGGNEFNFQIRSPEHAYGEHFAIPSSVSVAGVRVEAEPVRVQTAVKPQYIYTDQLPPRELPRATTVVAAAQLEPGRTTAATVSFSATQAFPNAKLNLGIGEGLEVVPGTIRLDGRPVAFVPGSTTALSLGDLAAGEHTITFEVFWQSFNPGVVSAGIAPELELPGMDVALPREELQFKPVFTPAVSTPAAPRGAPAPIGPPAWSVIYRGIAGATITIDAEGNFRVPDNRAVFGEFAGAYGHVDRETLDYALTNDQGHERRGNARAEGWIIAAVMPATPAAAQPTTREITLRINDAIYKVSPSGAVESPPSDRNQYFIDRAGNIHMGSPAGEIVYVVNFATGELRTPGPQGETVGGFVATERDALVVEYVSGRADYYVRRATKDAQARGEDPQKVDIAVIRELIAKGVEPDRIAAAALKEWNNDALRVVRAAAGAGASAEAIREALEGREVRARTTDVSDAFTVAVGQAVAEAAQRTGAERVQGMGELARFLRESGMSAGDTADKLKAAGFMDDPKAVLREAGYSDDAVSTLERRVPASQVWIVNVDGRWLALYPDGRVRVPEATRPASIVEDSLYVFEGRFFLGSFPLQEKPFREMDIVDKDLFLLYQAKFQADGLGRSQAIAATFSRAIAAWGSNPARILRAANLAGLTNVEIVQGLAAADQTARAAGSPTRYLEEGILTAVKSREDGGLEASGDDVVRALKDANLGRERLDELVQYLAPRLNLTEAQLRAELGLTRLERQALLGTFSVGESEYWFDIVAAGRVAGDIIHPRGSQVATPHRAHRAQLADGSWDPVIIVKLGNVAIGHLEYERDYEERGSRNQLKRYQYVPAFQADGVGVVRERTSQRITGRIRKQADGTLTFTGYQRLEYPQGSGTYFHVPGPRDASGRGPAGAVLNDQGQMLPVHVDENGTVTGLRKRFFGQITSAGFLPAYTAQVGAQVFDINIVSGDVYSFAADRGGFKTDYQVVRSGADYEVRQGGTTGPVIAKITAALKVLAPDGTEIGVVKQTDFQQTPIISFYEFIRQKRGIRPDIPGLTKQDRWWEDAGPVSPPAQTAPDFGFGTGSSIPLEPFVFDFPRYLDPDIVVAAGIQPGAVTEAGAVAPIINTDGSLHFELSDGRVFDAPIPVIGTASGGIGDIAAQLPAPASEAQVVAQLAPLLSAGTAPASFNTPLVQDAASSSPVALDQLVAQVRPTVPGTTEPHIEYIRYRDANNDLVEVPKDTRSGVVVDPVPVRVNGNPTDSFTFVYPDGSTAMMLHRPGGGPMGQGRILTGGDELFGVYAPDSPSSRVPVWQYQGRIRMGAEGEVGSYQPASPEARNATVIGTTAGPDGISVVLTDQQSGWLYAGGERTPLRADLHTGAVHNTLLAGGDPAQQLAPRNVVGWLENAQPFSIRELSINAPANQQVFSDLTSLQQANLLPESRDLVFFGGDRSFAVEPNLGSGRVFDIVPLEGDRFGVRESSTQWVGGDGFVRQLTGRTRSIDDPVLFELRLGAVYEGRWRIGANPVAIRNDLLAVDPAGRGDTYIIRPGTSRLARQAAQRFGRITVGGNTYYFSLARRDLTFDSTEGQTWSGTVGTGFDSRGQLTGNAGYRLTLGSLELPDGIHQAYLVHQGDNPNIVGLIDRSEETLPSFRGQFSTFISSSAVLTLGGTIRDMTTGGILRGVDESSLLSGGETALHQASGPFAAQRLFGRDASLRVEASPAAASEPLIFGHTALLSRNDLENALAHSLAIPGLGAPLDVVGIEVLRPGATSELDQIVGAYPVMISVEERPVIQFQAFSLASPIGAGGLAQQGSLYYDLTSGAVQYQRGEQPPEDVFPSWSRLIVALPRAERTETVMAVNRGYFDASRAAEVREALRQNQELIRQLKAFARRQNIAFDDRYLAVELTVGFQSTLHSLLSTTMDGRESLLVTPMRPVLNADQRNHLLVMAHEFGHFLSMLDERETIDQFRLLAGEASRQQELRQFVAETKRFVGPERRADVFAASVASELVQSGAWNRTDAERAIGELVSSMAQAEVFMPGANWALDIHDSPVERSRTMQYALDFYLRHPELLGGPLTIQQAPTGRIQSRISKTAAAPSPTTASPIAGGFVKTGGGSVNPFVEPVASEHLSQLNFFGVFATSPTATSTATTTAPTVFSGDNVLQASSTDQIVFRWSKVPGAESYWYSSDLTRITGTQSYSWVRLDGQPGIIDRGDTYELTLPANTFPAGQHWFQITAGSADNRADWARSDTGYPFRFVRLRIHLVTSAMLRVIPRPGPITTLAPIQDIWLSNETTGNAIIAYATFAFRNEGSHPISISGFTMKIAAPLGFHVLPEARLTNFSVRGLPVARYDHFPDGSLRFSLLTPFALQPGDERSVFGNMAVVQDTAVPATASPSPVGGAISVVLTGVEVLDEEIGSQQPVVISESLVVPADYDAVSNGTYDVLDVQVVDKLARLSWSPQDVIDFLINRWHADFSRIVRAAMRTSLPLSNIIRTFRQQGYLRQIVQAALVQGADPRAVLRALREADISFEELHQLQGYFRVSDATFHDLLAQSGLDADAYESTVVHTEGFHLVSDSYYGGSQNPEMDQQYRRIVLKAVYLVPQGEQPQQNWYEGMNVLMEEAARLYERELRGSVAVEFTVFPVAVAGEQSNPNYDYEHSENGTTEVIRRLFRQRGDHYDPNFSQRQPNDYDVVVTFIEGGGGAAGWGLFRENSFDSQRDDIPRGSIFGAASVVTRPDGLSSIAARYRERRRELPFLFYVTLHEVGHTLGLPHAWEVIENPVGAELDGGFHNVVGHVMSYSSAEIAPEAYFIPDSLINLLVGRPSLSAPLSPPTLHADPAPPARDARLTLQDNIIAYINTESTVRRISDALILRALLGSGIGAKDIVDAFRTASGGGIGRLIRAARGAGIAPEDIIVTLWQQGFTLPQLKTAVVRDALNYGIDNTRYQYVDPEEILQRRNLIAPSPPESLGQG